MNAICLAIDGLHAGYLGPFGNTWVRTPSLDRLAAEGFVADQLFLDSPDLAALHRSYWQGLHAMAPEPPGGLRPTLAAMAGAAGHGTALLTDDPAVADHPLARDFGEVVEIDEPQRAAPAETVEETRIAGCFSRIIEWLDSAPPRYLLWCHLRGLAAPWDAPLEFRGAYADEDDPAPPAGIDVPDRVLGPNYDPDELLGYTHSYAGQITLLDTCLGALDEFLASSPAGAETLLAIVGARGFPLGEHGRVGRAKWATPGEPVEAGGDPARDDALFAELTHVPLLLRLPKGQSAATRSQALLEPSDLWAMLAEYSGCAAGPPLPAGRGLAALIAGEAEDVRDRLVIRGPGRERAMVTPAWYLRLAERPQLFVRPDDFWQVNDVADRCTEVAEKLASLLADFEQAVGSGGAALFPPLDEVLRAGLE